MERADAHRIFAQDPMQKRSGTNGDLVLGIVLSASRRHFVPMPGDFFQHQTIRRMLCAVITDRFHQISRVSFVFNDAPQSKIRIDQLIAEADAKISLAVRDGVMNDLKMIRIKFRAALHEKAVAQRERFLIENVVRRCEADGSAARLHDSLDIIIPKPIMIRHAVLIGIADIGFGHDANALFHYGEAPFPGTRCLVCRFAFIIAGHSRFVKPIEK